MNKVSARQKRINFTGWMFMLPALVFGTVFLIVPIVMCFVFSFTDFYMLRPESTLFVGFENYVDLFSDAIFGKAITNTLLFVVVVVPLQCLLALVLAAAMLLLSGCSSRSCSRCSSIRGGAATASSSSRTLRPSSLP